MMYADAIKAAQNLASIVPLLGGSTSRKDYEAAIKWWSIWLSMSQIARW